MERASVDFSRIPCAGVNCFRLPIAERKTCMNERRECPSKHKAPDDHWQCRCCADCARACEEN